MTYTGKYFVSIIFVLLSLQLQAQDYRQTHPDAWDASTVKDAIYALYGDVNIEENKALEIIAQTYQPTLASLPMRIRTTIPTKNIAILLAENDRVLISVIDTLDGENVDYYLRIKVPKGSDVIVIIEGKDGYFYSNNISFEYCTQIHYEKEDN
ncbi:MAG: hypothetical protein GQ531_04240 [Sulfurovum sp.]|nr:hypothetical protein [Sulfurovum sp.]